MSFANWLLNYDGGDQAVMNLSTDAGRNPPFGRWSVEELRQHMDNHGASDEALAVVDVAERLWRYDRQRVAETSKAL